MTKLQIKPNDQAPNSIGLNLSWPLELAVWSFFGVLKLEIGILQTES
jgi:hypothetical protein